MNLTCYVDEAGCPGKLPAGPTIVQPFLIVAAMALPSAEVGAFTHRLNMLKGAYLRANGSLAGTAAPLALEIKGSALRAQLRRSPGGVLAAHRLLDGLLSLLKASDARIFAAIAPKPAGGEFDGVATYAFAMHRLACEFHQWLDHQDADGVMVADFREPQLNAAMARPVGASKFGEVRDALPRLLDVPLFGHSESHAGLQAVDWLVSALIFAAVSERHSSELPGHPLLHENDAQFARRYRKRLRGLLPPAGGARGIEGLSDMYGLARLLE